MTQVAINTDADISLGSIEDEAKRVYGHGNFKLTKSNDRIAGCRVHVECTVSYSQKNGVLAESWYEERAMLMAYAALVVLPSQGAHPEIDKYTDPA